MVKRRSTIEPAIGHMQSDGRLASNPLQGALDDALHAVIRSAVHNIRLILKKLRLPCPRIARAVHAVGGVWGASFYRNAPG
ncbi:hypothetical protein THIX_10461 [Thiomonas sp. X19]|nr:hypothetical protein THIX_10461 [Thiomonas sp. X19]